MTDDPDQAPLWAPFLDALPVDGGSISVISRAGVTSTVSASDHTAARLDELQVQLGEGPRWQAFRSGEPVTITNTRAGCAMLDNGQLM